MARYKVLVDDNFHYIHDFPLAKIERNKIRASPTIVDVVTGRDKNFASLHQISPDNLFCECSLHISFGLLIGAAQIRRIEQPSEVHPCGYSVPHFELANSIKRNLPPSVRRIAYDPLPSTIRESSETEGLNCTNSYRNFPTVKRSKKAAHM